jgi:hypothetical protein
MKTELLAGLAVVAVAIALPSCKPTKLDHKKMEDMINSELTAKGVALKSVSCPDDRKIKSGDTFDCTGIDSDDEHLVFTVDQQDDIGTIKWKLDGMIINKEKIGDSIEKKVGATADVQCPSKTVIVKVGGTFNCDVMIDAKKHHVLLTLTNAAGDVTWKIVD